MPRKSKIFTHIELKNFHPTGRTFAYAGSRKFLVDNGIPGEIAEIEHIYSENDRIVARARKIENPSEYRVKPFCIHAGLCGGCNWQHIHYEQQLVYKQHILEWLFKKAGINISEAIKVFPTPSPYFFRNKLTYQFTETRWFLEGEDKVEDNTLRCGLGFHLLGQHSKIIDIKECYLQAEPSETIRNFVKAQAIDMGIPFCNRKTDAGTLISLTIKNSTQGDCMVIVGYRKGFRTEILPLAKALLLKFPVITSIYLLAFNSFKNNTEEGELEHFAGKENLKEKFLGLEFQFGPKSFIQSNPVLAEIMYSRLACTAGITGNENVLDLYSGTGIIGCLLARNGANVHCIESNKESFHYALNNIKLNQLRSIECHCGEVSELFTSDWPDKYGQPDIIVVDPPRSGVHPKNLETLLQIKADKIIYVSCQAESLVRDLKVLCPCYTIQKMELFDFYPHTHQLETLVLLQKKMN